MYGFNDSDFEVRDSFDTGKKTVTAIGKDRKTNV